MIAFRSLAFNEPDWQCTSESNIETRSRDNCYHGKAVNIAYSECVSVVNGILLANRIGHIVMCVGPALPYFPTLSHKYHDFRGVGRSY